MQTRESQPAYEEREPERQRETAERAIDDALLALSTFRASGNQERDIEAFLEITDRREYLHRIHSGEINGKVLLSEIREFQIKSLEEGSHFSHRIDEADPEYQLKFNYYKEIPIAEVAAINAIFAINESVSRAASKESSRSGEDVSLDVIDERIKVILEIVDTRFRTATKRLFSLEADYTLVFETSLGKLARFYAGDQRRPSVFMGIHVEEHQAVKRFFANIFAIYQKGNARLRSLFCSLADPTSKEIDEISEAVSQVFRSIDEGEEDVRRCLDSLSSRINSSPVKGFN